MNRDEAHTLNSGKKLVLVTGSAKRLGAAIAIHFAKSDYDVIIHYNNSINEAKELVSKIKEIGPDAMMIKADLTNELDDFINKTHF